MELLTGTRGAGAVGDPRFDVPLYGVTEAARHLGIPVSTLRYWVFEKHIVRHLAPSTKNGPCLPFVAMAEAQFIQGLRAAHLSLQAVTEGVVALKAGLGPNYLVQNLLAHDGRDILFRLGEHDESWERARDRQSGIPGVIDTGLRAIAFDEAGLPSRVTLSAYEGADVVVDPRFAFGQPVVSDRGVRVEDIAELFLAGDTVTTVSREFGIDTGTVEAIVRTYARRAA